VKFEYHTERPYIRIDGVRYDVTQKEALMFELLLKHRGQQVSSEVLRNYCGCSDRSLRVYSTTLRSILNQYGYHVSSHPRTSSTYALVKGQNEHAHQE
jgi:transcriptional antiterminator